jgi:hypothetical protein
MGKPMLKAIPTMYGGVQFRSRLEARWAAFFDLAGWRWQYEPIDLDGWIPDFRLCGSVPALCEVKPIDFAEFDDGEKASNCIQRIAPNVIRIRDRYDRSPSNLFSDHEIIVLGLGPVPSGMINFNDGCSIPIFGYMLHEYCTGAEDWAVICSGYEPQHLDYIAKTYSWWYRIGGQYDGDHHLKFIKDRDVEDIWRLAGNFVQWKAPA